MDERKLMVQSVVNPVKRYLLDVYACVDSVCSRTSARMNARPGGEMSKFQFVDFAARYQKGFRNHVVPLVEVPKLISAFGSYGCYATYFLYSDELFTYMSAHAKGSASSLAGYEGRVWATRFPLDLDNPELTVALDAARSLLALFLDHWMVDPNGIQVYFSGLKGFHLMLDTRLFGRVVPSKSLPLQFASMRRHLAQKLASSEREAVDLSVSDRVRLLRLPNTVHEKSGLYKVFLSLTEVKELDAAQIRDLARSTRPLTLTDETGLLATQKVRENPKASLFFRRIRRQIRRATRKPFSYRFRPPLEKGAAPSFACAALMKIWESHIDVGFRNNCAIRLASEFRLMGFSDDQARTQILHWNERNEIGLPFHEIDGIIGSAYSRPFPYRYGCKDEIRRHFCPLASYEECRRFASKP